MPTGTSVGGNHRGAGGAHMLQLLRDEQRIDSLQWAFRFPEELLSLFLRAQWIFSKLAKIRADSSLWHSPGPRALLASHCNQRTAL